MMIGECTVVCKVLGHTVEILLHIFSQVYTCTDVSTPPVYSYV